MKLPKLLGKELAVECHILDSRTAEDDKDVEKNADPHGIRTRGLVFADLLCAADTLPVKGLFE
jgi:hypothetical protein